MQHGRLTVHRPRRKSRRDAAVAEGDGGILSLVVAFDQEHTRQSDAGTTRYARSLLRALNAREDVRMIPLGGGPLLRRGTLQKRLATLRQDLWWYPLRGRLHARRVGASVYHCPTPRAPLTRGKPPLVVTIHDLVPIRFPHTVTPYSRLYERATIRALVRAVDRVIVPSSDSADDVNSIMRVPARKIRVIPLGVDEVFFSDREVEPLVARPYVLFVGTPQPRKNLARLAEAVRIIQRRGFPERLVVAGAGGWGAVQVPQSEIELTGRVTDADLYRLMRHASCLALTSLHEGFGLPVVEAMAAGTPVVASDAGALPETAAGAAVLVDPLDVESIAGGIMRAIAERDTFVAAGRERVRELTWDVAAERTVAVYREVA